MAFVLKFAGNSIDLDVDPQALTASWSGPASLSPSAMAEAIRVALASPVGYPRLNQSVVPGDRVVLALDPSLPELPAIVELVIEHLEESGLERHNITAVLADRADAPAPSLAVEGIEVRAHDPDNRNELAYLSSTSPGRRIYLNRALIDADVTFVIGGLGVAPGFGLRGPWSVLFPGLSDRETIIEKGAAVHKVADDSGPADEATEVAWLLGNQLQMGVLDTAGGVGDAVVSRFDLQARTGSQMIEKAWTFRAPERAEVVVAGIHRTEGLGPLIQGLSAAARLVRRGGRVVVLSRSRGMPGEALQALAAADHDRQGAAALADFAAASDYSLARRLAEALDWADLYVHAEMSSDLLESIGLTPIEKPESARRLIGAASSVITLNHADYVRPLIAE